MKGRILKSKLHLQLVKKPYFGLNFKLIIFIRVK